MAALPDKIGRYQIRDVIGTGGFATVYRALDERFGVEVALKVLAENRSFEPEVRERFLEEGRRLRRLRSPHLVTVHDLAETDRGQPYLVLELADRGDLATRSRQLRQIGWQPALGDVRHIIGTLTAALGTLHRHNLVHRDVAPRNLLLRLAMAPRATPMLTSDEALDAAELAAAGVSARPRPAPPLDPSIRQLVADGEQLLLSDLGVSKDLAAASGLTLAAGTAGFAPPEQREPGHRIDQRADIWAASALVVWIAANRTPDEDDAWPDHLSQRGWPAGFAEALSRGLAERAPDRHPTIDDWGDTLEAALAPPPAVSVALVPAAEPVPEPAPVPHPERPRAPEPPASRRRHIVILALTLGATLLTGLGLGAFLSRDTSSSPTTETVVDGETVRTTAEGNGVRLVLEGPAEATVGETVTLTATVTGTDTWTWIGPDGAVAASEPMLQVSPQTPGEGVIRLLSFDDQGQAVEATHALVITRRE